MRRLDAEQVREPGNPAKTKSQIPVNKLAADEKIDCGFAPNFFCMPAKLNLRISG